jgi:CRP/FNR family transcriptional regulator, cyclic AMP receptor protein
MGKDYSVLNRKPTVNAVANNIRRQSQMRALRRPVIASQQSGNPFERTLPLNSPLRAIAGIERVGFSRLYPRGAVLFSEGHGARGVYVLCTGSAKISICSADGKKLIMRIAKPGDVLGLYAGLTGRPYEATAELLKPARVTFVSRQNLLELIASQEAFGLGLVQVFSEQFSEFVDHARLLQLSESATEKLARLILKWGRDFGELTAGGIRLQILLTQEEIAQIIGSSRETVTRLFSALKRRQIIGVKRGTMVIRNSAALASLAQMPSY